VKAARIHSFGPADVVVVEDVPMPSPGPGEVLVRVMAAGVAPWDAIIREGKSKVSPQPPLTLGSDISGVVEKVGPGVTGFAPADEVYGVTNPQFCGAQAEFAVATSGMVARKPRSLNHVEAASAPVIAVTAWQMLFQYAQAMRGQTVMVVGAAGNVGAYAVQMAVDTGIHVVAIATLRRRESASIIGREIHHRLQQTRIRAGPPTGGCYPRHGRGQHVSTLHRCVETRRQTRHLGLDAAAPSRGHFLLR
jgi:NADPH:quinone reductase-like Zn-dependent oxidoreductase